MRTLRRIRYWLYWRTVGRLRLRRLLVSMMFTKWAQEIEDLLLWGTDGE